MIYTPHHIKGNAHALWYKYMCVCWGVGWDKYMCVCWGVGWDKYMCVLGGGVG